MEHVQGKETSKKEGKGGKGVMKSKEDNFKETLGLWDLEEVAVRKWINESRARKETSKNER